MRPEHHIRRLLDQSDRLAHGAFELEVLLSAREGADRLDDDDLRYVTELRLSSWAMLRRDDALRLDAFGRCLRLHRSDPLRFPTSVDDLDLLWDHATIPRALASSHLVSAEGVQRSLDDMLDVYTAAGADPTPYLLACYEWSLRGPAGAEAEPRERVLRSLARRPGACCRGCLHAVELRRHLAAGRDAAAIAELDALVEENDDCPTEPEDGTAAALLALVRSGRASDALVLSEGLGRTVPRAGTSIAGARIALAAAVSDLDQATSLAVGALDRLDRHARSTEQVVDLIAGLGALLDATTRAGGGSAVVSWGEHPALARWTGPHVGSWTAATLGRAVWSSARDLAGRLDARDGGTRKAAAVERVRATGRGPRSVVAVRAALRAARPSTDHETESLPDPDECLQSAREDAAAGRRRRALDLVEAGLLGADSLQRAALLGLRVRILLDDGDRRAAEAALEHRIECLIVDDLDDEAEIDLELGLLLFGDASSGAVDARDRFSAALERSRRLGLSAPALARLLVAYGSVELRTGHLGEADRLLAEALDLVRSDPVHRHLRVSALLLRARARGASGDHSGSMALLDAVLREDVDLGLRAATHLHRAHALLAQGLIRGGVEEADRALAAHARLGDRDGVVDTCGLLATLLTELGELDGAVEARRTAAETATTLGREDAPSVRFELARALVRAGRGGEARPVLDDLLELRPPAAGSAPGVAELLRVMGEACREEGDDAGAYAAWSVALEHLRDAEADDSVARGAEIRLALAELLNEQDAIEAIDVLRPLPLARLGGRLRLDVLLQLARSQAALGLEDARNTLTAARRAVRMLTPGATTGYGDAEAVLLETEARALDDLGAEQEAIAAARSAAAAFERIGDPAGGARMRLFAGRLLALARSDREARTELALAAAVDSPDGRAARAELVPLTESPRESALGPTTLGVN